MPHVNQQVRNFITDTLTTAAFMLGPDAVKVYESQIYQLNSKQLPAVAVTSGGQAIETRQARRQPSIQSRDIKVNVACAVIADSLVENDMDSLALMVENRIMLDPTLGGLAVSTYLTSVDPFLSRDGDRPFGILNLTFVCRVLTLEGQAEKSIQQP